jgi:hypothetical protein
LQKFIKSIVDDQLNTNKQGLQSDGLSKASYKVASTSPEQVTIQTTATAGPQLDLASLKKQIAGKKAGEVRSDIKTTPGVTDVSVHYSPFWVTSAPKNTSKITITVQKSTP